MTEIRALADNQDEAVAFLSDPRSHGPEVDKVERIDTHAALVFLAGDRAYKIKRAVRYPYLDFTTLRQRREACERELVLNRRTAPQIYLKVEAVVRRADGTLTLGGRGDPVEWAVVMVRFRQDLLFDRLAQDGRLTSALILRLADRVAAFHDGAEAITGDGFGNIKWTIDETLEELAEASFLFSRPAVSNLRAGLTRRLDELEATLRQRSANGLVRRCHGDLHLRNIVLLQEQPVLFDCIEFNDRIACSDVLYDLAFLLMDLDHRNLRSAANLLLNRYLRRRSDLSGLAALPLFLATRAAIRAKVTLSAAQAIGPAEGSTDLETEAHGYFRLSQSYLEPKSPQLIAVGGFSGSGKTRLAGDLAPEIGAAPGALHLRSDVLRKDLLGVDELTRLPETSYDKATSRRVYDTLLTRAKTALEAGHSVLLDASFIGAGERIRIEALARDSDAAFIGLWLEADQSRLLERVAHRRGDASDATQEVVRRQQRGDPGTLSWLRLDANPDYGDVLRTARSVLRARPPVL